VDGVQRRHFNGRSMDYRSNVYPYPN
jgi:hypothetical protein